MFAIEKFRQMSKSFHKEILYAENKYSHRAKIERLSKNCFEDLITKNIHYEKKMGKVFEGWVRH